MKILKKPDCVIFDTLNVNKIKQNPCPNYGRPIPLHHFSDKTDFEFLKEHFKEDHRILKDFGNSYYFYLSV